MTGLGLPTASSRGTTITHGRKASSPKSSHRLRARGEGSERPQQREDRQQHQQYGEDRIPNSYRE